MAYNFDKVFYTYRLVESVKILLGFHNSPQTTDGVPVVNFAILSGVFGGTVASVVPELVLTRGVRVLTGIAVAFVHRVDFAINSSRTNGTVAHVTFRVRYSTYSSVLARVGIAIVSAKFAIFPVITLLASALVARMHCGAHAAVLAGRGRTKINLENIHIGY